MSPDAFDAQVYELLAKAYGAAWAEVRRPSTAPGVKEFNPFLENLKLRCMTLDHEYNTS
jgi:hypothetical protein